MLYCCIVSLYIYIWFTNQNVSWWWQSSMDLIMLYFTHIFIHKCTHTLKTAPSQPTKCANFLLNRKRFTFCVWELKLLRCVIYPSIHPFQFVDPFDFFLHHHIIIITLVFILPHKTIYIKYSKTSTKMNWSLFNFRFNCILTWYT